MMKLIEGGSVVSNSEWDSIEDSAADCNIVTAALTSLESYSHSIIP